MLSTRPTLALMLLASLASSGSAAEKWGTIKGRVVIAGEVPARPAIAAAALVPACKACAAPGGTLDDTWVVDPKTKGVRWVMVWLQHESGDFAKAIRVHPRLAKPAAPTVVLDQPCCMFEPHNLCMRAGQTLVIKNSAAFAHNVNIIGGGVNPEKNVAVPAGAELAVPGWVASRTVVPVQCNIHGWMRANVRVFDHPYFAVTNGKGEFEIKDAPAGKLRLAVWHDEGWVVGDRKGIPVEIKDGAVTDVGELKARK